MRNINLGGSWMDEFYKIAEEKGWVVKKAISHDEIEKIWGSLPKEQKDELIPGWDEMPFAILVERIENVWGPIMLKYQGLQQKPEVKPVPVHKEKKMLSPQLIAKIQALLFKATGLPVSNPQGKFLGAPDGMWGPLSAKAWNKYIEKYTTVGGPLVVDPVDLNGEELPSIEDIRYVLSNPELPGKVESDAKDPWSDWKMPSLSPEEKEKLISTKIPTSEEVAQKMKERVPGQQPGDIVVSPKTDWRSRYPGLHGIPDDVTESEHLAVMKNLRQQGYTGAVSDRNKYMQTLKQIREQRKTQPSGFSPKIPDWAKADDVTASVLNELVSLADDLESFGEEKVAVMVDHQLKSYAAAIEKLYDITGEKGEDLIDQAHPGGGPTMAPAKDEGGKVETIVEEHKKVVDKSTKQPTGKYAQTMAKLITTANRLEEEGNVKAAKIVDQTINELRQLNPFVNRSLVSEATNSKDITASIKTADNANLSQYIPIWDKIINEKFVPLADAISHSNTLEIFHPKSKKIKYAYKSAKAKVYNIGSRWKKGEYTRQTLADDITKLINVLNVQDADALIRDLYTVPFTSRLSVLHFEIIEGLRSLRNKLISDMKKNPVVTKTVPKKKNLSLGEKIKQKITNDYLAQLKTLEQIIINNTLTVSKVLDVDKLAKWIEDKRYNIRQVGTDYKFQYQPTPQDVEKLHNFIQNLKEKISKSASLRIKAARAIPGEDIYRNKPNQSNVNKPSRPSLKKDSDVGRIQQIMMNLKIPLQGGADQIWGKHTMNAWNQLRKMIPKAQLSLATSPKDYSSLKPEFDRAERFGQYLASQVKKESTKFTLDSKEFTAGDFDSVRNFLASLDRNYNLNRDQMHDEEYMKTLREKVLALYKALNGNEGTFISNYYGPQALNILKVKLVQIIRQIRQYGLPKSQQPGSSALWPEAKRPGQEGRGQKLPELETRPGGTKEVTPSEGKKDSTFAISFPINSAEDVVKAVNSLPSLSRINNLEAFELYSNSMNYGGETDRITRMRRTWQLMNARIAYITRKADEYKQILASQNVHKPIIDALMEFNANLNYIGRQLGMRK